MRTVDIVVFRFPTTLISYSLLGRRQLGVRAVKRCKLLNLLVFLLRVAAGLRLTILGRKAGSRVEGTQGGPDIRVSSRFRHRVTGLN